MNNSHQEYHSGTSIGLIADEALSETQDAQISGNTSSGVFIKTTGKWLVFLAFERFKGPLTITLKKFNPVLQRVPVGGSVRIAPSSLFFPHPGITINLENTPVWQPPPPSQILLDRTRRHANLVFVAQEIMSKEKPGGLGGLIPAFLGLPDSRPQLSTVKGLDGSQLELFKKFALCEESVQLAEPLSSILGSGPGLTPSTDDFTLGLLLAMNRWRIPSWNSRNLRFLNSRIVEAAYQKTTTLSANLIECASRGLADERLINALDWIVTGAAREPEVITHLLSWGNSSGIDAFLGMTVALTV